MKAKYLGVYYYNLNIDMNYDTDVYDVLVNENDEDDFYPMEFINTDNDSLFDGIMGETNSSAIALKIINDEYYKLWRIY